jgi:hypothetical protein
LPPSTTKLLRGPGKINSLFWEEQSINTTKGGESDLGEDSSPLFMPVFRFGSVQTPGMKCAYCGNNRTHTLFFGQPARAACRKKVHPVASAIDEPLS